jgi:hypothetical protein
VTSAVGLVVGFALFGALTFLRCSSRSSAATPDRVGACSSAVMGGLLFTSILSGR